MKHIKLGVSNMEVPSVAVGCMRINRLGEQELKEYVHGCVEIGATFFDHADIYGGGSCEEAFGKVLREMPSLRQQIFLQSKCGIVPGKMYDLSRQYLLQSVDGILKRLHTEYLDMLLLHRPDALIEPEEVAEAFDELLASGKVRNFGVSNQNPMQIRLLKKYVKHPILVNQLQLSLPSSNMIAAGLEVNMTSRESVDHDGSVLDYCRLEDITIQVWSPFQKPEWKGLFLGDSEYKELNQCLEKLAEVHHATPTMIATAWILRHPAHMQMIAGTTRLSRMQEIVKAANIELTRQEWYELYLAAGHQLP